MMLLLLNRDNRQRSRLVTVLLNLRFLTASDASIKAALEPV
jgi:hypothetical protein